MFSLFFRAKRVFVRWSADFQSEGLAIKARCKLACERGLRDYTQGRVGRPPRFRLTKKKFIYHLLSIILSVSYSLVIRSIYVSY